MSWTKQNKWNVAVSCGLTVTTLHEVYDIIQHQTIGHTHTHTHWLDTTVAWILIKHPVTNRSSKTRQPIPPSLISSKWQHAEMIFVLLSLISPAYSMTIGFTAEHYSCCCHFEHTVLDDFPLMSSSQWKSHTGNTCVLGSSAPRLRGVRAVLRPAPPQLSPPTYLRT